MRRPAGYTLEARFEVVPSQDSPPPNVICMNPAALPEGSRSALRPRNPPISCGWVSPAGTPMLLAIGIAPPEHNFASVVLDVSTGQPRDPAERASDEACRSQQPSVSQRDPLDQSHCHDDSRGRNSATGCGMVPRGNTQSRRWPAQPASKRSSVGCGAYSDCLYEEAAWINNKRARSTLNRPGFSGGGDLPLVLWSRRSGIRRLCVVVGVGVRTPLV